MSHARLPTTFGPVVRRAESAPSANFAPISLAPKPTNPSQTSVAPTQSPTFRSVGDFARRAREERNWKIETTPNPRVVGKCTDRIDANSLIRDIVTECGDIFGESLEKLKVLAEKCESESDLERKRAIYSLFEEMRKYMIVDIIQIIRTRQTCACGGELRRTTDPKRNALGSGVSAFIQVCESCSESTIDDTPVFDHSANSGGGDGDAFEHTVATDHSSYNDLFNFTRVWLAYHGMHKPRLPDDLHEKLDKYFVSIGMKTGAEYRAQPTIKNRYGELIKEGTSVQALHKALKSTGQPYYIDQFYIRNTYWGWPLPNAMNVEATVFNNYKRTQAVYREVCGDRNSCLNAMYRLYQELRAAGHECHSNTFQLQKTPEIRREYEETRRLMCELASKDGGQPIKFFATWG